MITVSLPSLGSDMDEGTLLQWHVKPGDAVHKGQVIAVVDTAKAAIDVECWHDGVVDALLVEPGTKIPVGTPMARLRGAREAAGSGRTMAVPAHATVSAAPAMPIVSAAPQPAEPAALLVAGDRVRASPAARRAAQQRGVDLRSVHGSGPAGAIGLADLPAAAAPSDRSAQMRRVIGAAMSRSKREIPHYYLSEDIVFEAASAWLAERNRALAPAERLLPAALLLKAVAMALRRYPEFNGFWRDDGFAAGSGIHLGVAIALRGGGLVAPALHDVDRLDTATLTSALLDLVRRTRAGSLRSSELADATLTVTNLGERSVASVFGVIHPPQVALVGLGRIAARPWIDALGGVRAVPMLTATLAADHRASDGHRGALFLAEMRELLQEPVALDASR